MASQLGFREKVDGVEIYNTMMYHEYINDSIEKKINETDFHLLPAFRGAPIEDARNELMEEFNNKKEGQLWSEAPEILEDFRDYVRNIFNPKDIIKICNHWPPVIPADKPETELMIYWLLKFVHDCEKPHRVLHWLEKNVYKLDLVSNENSCLGAISLVKAKGRVKEKDPSYWATLKVTKDGCRFVFKMRGVNDGRLYPVVNSTHVEDIKLDKKGKIVTIFGENQQKIREFVPVDDDRGRLWTLAMSSDHAPFPLFFGKVARPLPNEYKCSCYEAIIADDGVVTKVLYSYEVISVTNQGLIIMDALLDIYAHAGKVNQFLEILLHAELQRPESTRDKVMRQNTNYTNMWKVIQHRFGREYYEKVIKKMLKFVDSNGGVNWHVPDEASVKPARSIIFTIMKYILESGSLVPPHMKHVLSMVKSYVTLKFNDKQATYNAMSALFFLRFFNGCMADQSKMDPEYHTQNDLFTFIIPFTQILQKIFSLTPFDNDSPFAVFNERLIERVFPKLMDFTMDLGNYEGDAQYDQPSEQRLNAALDLIIDQIAQVKDNKFRRNYELVTVERNGQTVTGQNFASFLLAFFKENTNNQIYQKEKEKESQD